MTTSTTIVDGFTIPRQQISILAGASGAGKTTLLMHAISCWAHRGQFTSALTWDATRIAYLVADRNSSEVRARAAALGIEDDKMEIYGIQDDLTFNLSVLRTPHIALEQCIAKFKQPFDMLIIDPIVLFIDGNTNDIRSVAMSLMRIGRIAVARNITILAVHHAKKMTADQPFLRPQDRINGSGAFQGFSGTQMVLIQGSETGKFYDTFIAIPHTSPMIEVALIRDARGGFEVFDPGGYEAECLIEFRNLVAEKPLNIVIDMKTIHTFLESKGLAVRTCAVKWTELLIADGTLTKTGKDRYVRTEDLPDDHIDTC